MSFGLGSKHYEIDLSEENEERLRQALNPYLANARKVTRASRDTSMTARSRNETAAIRAWAQQQGMDVPPRGRLPCHIVESYEQAHH